MSKEVVKKEETALSPEAMSWGQEQHVTSQDIVIPKILPLQFMSEKVKNKEGEYGEFRDTGNNDKFGDLENPFEVIPVAMEKKWIEFDVITSKSGQRKREFKQVVPIQDNPTQPGYNDELPLVDGDVERDRIMDFYVLIPGQVAEGAALPYVLSFRRTSLKGGKQLATQMFVRNRAAGKPPAGVVMQVSGKSKQNDDGEFVVQEVKTSRSAKNEEISEAFKWFKMILGGKTKVDDSDLSGGKPQRDVTAEGMGDF